MEYFTACLPGSFLPVILNFARTLREKFAKADTASQIIVSIVKVGWSVKTKSEQKRQFRNLNWLTSL